MEDVHKKILRKNHCCIVDTLDLYGSKVMDVLLEDGVISSDEQCEILSKAIKRDQNARLLSVLKRKSPSKKPFETFLKALQPEYDFIVQALRTQENNYEDCEYQKDIETKCYYCLLKQNLNPNHLSHILYEKEVISDDDVEDLNKNDMSRHDRVCILLNILRKHPDQEFASRQFRSSLEAKYGHLLTDKDDDGMDYLTCRCPNNIQVKARRKENLGRQTLSRELCSASYSKSRIAMDIIEKEPGRSTFNRTHEKEKTFGRNITDACDGLKDKIGIRKGRNMSNRNLSPLLQAESYHDERINVTRRKASAVREKSEVYEPRSSKCVSKLYCQKYPSQNLLVRQIPMVLPNNNTLMRKSAQLWNILYGMMARGEWNKFNRFFSEGLEKLDNADLKIQLYRSNMSACTFYRSDLARAQEMFEKAMELVPKTSMPTWHLGRILPLMVEIYVQKLKFSDASSLVEQAHQAVTLLSPCMPTGNVYFFQGLYLSTFLRCTRRDTQSAASIVERVKQCFLTAIHHYEQDTLFAVKPIIGQVYLFLALFSLGVDYKNRYYYQTHNACANDIKMSQHYLDLFESCCWEDSSNWSQMLFFIARGEQFKQMQNLKRSIDYFKDARRCSVLGNFNEHRGFIDNTIQLIEEKLKERTLIQCSQLHSSDTILQSLMEISDDSK